MTRPASSSADFEREPPECSALIRDRARISVRIWRSPGHARTGAGDDRTARARPAPLTLWLKAATTRLGLSFRYQRPDRPGSGADTKISRCESTELKIAFDLKLAMVSLLSDAASRPRTRSISALELIPIPVFDFFRNADGITHSRSSAISVTYDRPPGMLDDAVARFGDHQGQPGTGSIPAGSVLRCPPCRPPFAMDRAPC